MKLYSWNVNGIRAIQKKGFIDWVKTEQPDVLCLQETKANEDQLEDELINIEGYTSYFNSGIRKGYSGTAIYTKIKPKKIWTGLPDSRFNDEGRTQVLEFEDFILMNIYFPNGQKDEIRLQFKMDFYDEFLKYCNELRKIGKKIVVCGDYNTAHCEIDLKNPKANSKRSGFLPEERAWINKYIENGYLDIYRKLYPDKEEYSWWSYRFKARENNAGWRIDYFFITEDLIDQVEDALILTDVIGSDHCPIKLELRKVK